MDILLYLMKRDQGMTCEEYTNMIVAGIPSREIPQSVRDRMTQHEGSCCYHQSSAFLQSALGTPVTDEIEQGARDIIRKYSERKEEQCQI